MNKIECSPSPQQWLILEIRRGPGGGGGGGGGACPLQPHTFNLCWPCMGMCISVIILLCGGSRRFGLGGLHSDRSRNQKDSDKNPNTFGEVWGHAPPLGNF